MAEGQREWVWARQWDLCLIWAAALGDGRWLLDPVVKCAGEHEQDQGASVGSGQWAVGSGHWALGTGRVSALCRCWYLAAAACASPGFGFGSGSGFGFRITGFTSSSLLSCRFSLAWKSHGGV
jgi:hypothetical protein